MRRVSTYRIALLAILCAGIAAESRVNAERADLRLTRVLIQFPARLGSFQGADDTSPLAATLRQAYWPAAVVDRTYSDGGGNSVQVVIAPDSVGSHPESVCAQYSGWKVLTETTGSLPSSPAVHVTRTIEGPPLTQGTPATQIACEQYWRQEDRGLSQPEAERMMLKRGYFSFRVLMCSEIPNSGNAEQTFTAIETFAATADPVVHQFLHRAGKE